MQKQIPEHFNINGIFSWKNPIHDGFSSAKLYNFSKSISLILQQIVGEVNKKSNFSFS